LEFLVLSNYEASVLIPTKSILLAGGIYGIRNAGMSVAVGTWSSCMVIINFLVGIIAFQEPVSSIPSTFASFLLLGLGLVGMSVYSAPSASSSPSTPDSNNPLMETELSYNSLDPTLEAIAPVDRSLIADNHVTSRSPLARSRSNEGLEMSGTDNNYDPLRDPGDDGHYGSSDPYEKDGIFRKDSKKDRFVLFNNKVLGVALTKRQLGIMGAVINGVFTGSSLVPVHYAKKQGFGGAAYMLSFATGALLSNALVWAVWFCGKMVQSRDVRSNYESMPAWYFRQLWAPGFAAGILLAIAMFGSIMSVTYLGQGVGNSIIQSKILISGLWGIFWYKEITGGVTITKWFGSAALTVLGIMWLSFERINAKAATEHHL
jgi:Transmembrane family, TMEM144 of transporters